MDYIELGRKIRAARQSQQMTQAMLAEKVGISVSFVGHIERGSRIVSLHTFVMLCEALNVTPNELLGVSTALKLNKDQRKMVESLLEHACKLVKA